ncbi:hypothetical protein Pan258_32300 [Symmachiella dynata]|nr:hypothetical protein Pan258_32300 [Symmachiella dynata]
MTPGVKFTVILSSTLLCAVSLFPPRVTGNSTPVGRGFLFGDLYRANVPLVINVNSGVDASISYQNESCRIDFTRLILESLVIVSATIALVSWTTPSRKPKQIVQSDDESRP